MRALADRETCIGAGVCTTVTGVFEIADDGKVVVARKGDLDPSEIAGVEEAVAMCPVLALSLVEQEPDAPL